MIRATAPELERRSPLSVIHRPRAVISIGEQAIDPGPELVLETDAGGLAQSAVAWTERAQALASQSSVAKVYEKAHAAVADLAARAERSRAEGNRAAATAEERVAEAHQAGLGARSAATSLETDIRAWCTSIEDDPGFSLYAVGEGSWAAFEPAEALAVAEELANGVSVRAHGRAASHRARADALVAEAEQLRAEAGEARSGAAELRSGDALLPLPRPEWVSDVSDERSFGAALVWKDDAPDEVQDAIEDALSNSGVLGAALDSDGVAAASWAIHVRGERFEDSLADLLAPDTEHPLAEVAAAVLTRIELAADFSELDAAHGELVVALDGAFRAGPLVARPAAAGRQFARATHIGAARRRAAALERAAELERNAEGLEEEAKCREDDATTAIALAEAALRSAEAFPERIALRDAESARVGAARAEAAARAVAHEAELAAQGVESEARAAAETWRNDVGAAGLPPAIDALREFIAQASHAEAQLRSAGTEASGRLANRLGQLERDTRTATERDPLRELVAQASTDQMRAARARATYEELLIQHGSVAADIMRAYEEVQQLIGQLDRDVDAARRESTEAGEARARLDTLVDTSQSVVAEARPAAVRAVGELREFLGVEGVTAALLETEAANEDKELIAQVLEAAAGKKTAQRTLLEERDRVHAELIETWKVEPASAPTGLMAFVLTNENQSYSPVSAAAHAQRQAERAQEALSLAQEDALSRFVVGALPGAIATAWIRLQDWKRDVNNKMREAAASSGVGVSVRVNLREDLAPTERTLYELTCKAALSPESKRGAGECIAKLIDASSAEDMRDRVRDAVDIRNWVYVEYYVTRPDQEPKKWGKRTGLSGGERRLVVLAPMLAAIAAAYDKFGTSAPRLAALDEVPAEVDLAGREGLARYLAALDLDLVATSHEWDGAPGAWDGIDAQDLEQASDGTVIAFHMPIRSRDPLPGDSLAVFPAASASSDVS